MVLKAKNEVKIHKVFTGDLKQAIIYEDEAIRLFKNEKYGAAFYHSYIARFYANKSINANTGCDKKFIETLSVV
ncbi:MAG: hypothetical protein C0596_05535 [Marinilabiliales bacterium]|nr:MAG: hypothetical protein C0596_05535 [Marinilabiliales bacterium]